MFVVSAAGAGGFGAPPGTIFRNYTSLFSGFLIRIIVLQVRQQAAAAALVSLPVSITPFVRSFVQNSEIDNCVFLRRIRFSTYASSLFYLINQSIKSHSRRRRRRLQSTSRSATGRRWRLW
jgi:hypothetical protein